MSENFGNMFQIIVLCGCTFYALFRMVASRYKEWTKLFYFFGSFLMGDVYWQVCILFDKEFSPISLVANVWWYTSYICLIILEMQILKTGMKKEGYVKNRTETILPIIAPLFTLAMALFYMQLGDIVNNIIYGVLMGALLFFAIRGLAAEFNEKNNKAIKLFCSAVILFCFFEYAAWTVSCFYESEIMEKAYVVFDCMMTLSFPLFIPATYKVVKTEEGA